MTDHADRPDAPTAPVVLVTGVASGIGAATAHVLARDGWQVVGADRARDPVAGTHSERRRSYLTDLTADSAATHLVRAALEEFGRVDALVNVVGLATQGTLEDTDDHEWNLLVDLNLGVAARLTRAALPALKDTRGSVVNVTSVRGMRGSIASAVYSASKAALIGLTRQLCIDYARYGIRVNAVAPGIIHTPATEPRLKDESFVARTVGTTPLGRAGTAAEVAHAIAFLADARSSFITGHVLVVDGGASIAL